MPDPIQIEAVRSTLQRENQTVIIKTSLAVWDGLYFPAKNISRKALVFLPGADGYYEDQFSSYLVGFLRREFDDLAILILNYPSVNLSKGCLSMRTISQTAIEAFNYLHKEKKFSKKKILFYGQSMGGLAAIYGALILNFKIPIICERTCADLPNVIRNLYKNKFLGWIAKWILVIGGWRTPKLAHDIKKLKGPLFLIHNPYDGVVLRMQSLYYLIKDNFKGPLCMMEGEQICLEEHCRTFTKIEENLIAFSIHQLFL